MFKLYIEALLKNTQIKPYATANTSVYVTIYKNPTSEELLSCDEDTRGLIDSDGNLYVISNDEAIHIDILQGIADEINAFDDLDKDEMIKKIEEITPEEIGFLTVQRIRDTKAFMAGESLSNLDDIAIENVNIPNYYKKCKIKNPKFLFFVCSIDELSRFRNVADTDIVISKLMDEYEYV